MYIDCNLEVAQIPSILIEFPATRFTGYLQVQHRPKELCLDYQGLQSEGPVLFYFGNIVGQGTAKHKTHSH